VPALRRRRPPAFALVEVVVVLALGGVLAAAVAGVLLGHQRLFAAEEEILQTQQNVRAAAQILATELRGLDGSDGDLAAMSDTAVTIKAARGFGLVCAAPDPAARAITIGNSRYFGFRAIDPARDSVLLFREGDSLSASDDRWIRAAVVATGAARCPDDLPATRLVLRGLAGESGQLDGVTLGAPVRVFEVVRYRLYDDGSHTWWLGQQAFSDGWGATSPVVGPFRPKDGVRFAFVDADGLPTSDRTAVRQVGVTIRGRSARGISAAGRHPGPYEDSLSIRVYLRNSARP
jgi:type II secretory pathway pseudopilin PulG